MKNETTQPAVESTELVNDIQHVATPETKPEPKKTSKKSSSSSPKGKAMETKKAPKKAASKKTSKKTTPAPKATGKKAAKKATEKTTEKKNSPYIRVLQLLAKSPSGLTRKEIAEKSKVDNASLSGYLGRIDPEKRIADETKYGYTSLLTQKAIKVEKQDIDGKDVIVFSITAVGKKLLDKNS